MTQFTRRSVLRYLFAGGTTLAGVAGGRAFWWEPGQLSVTRRRIVDPRFPDGLKLAVLGDFHFRPGLDDALVEKVVRAVNAEQVDMVVLVGDYITNDQAVLPPLLQHLGKMQPRVGIYAVPGNHDGWHGGANRYAREFAKQGIDFLCNQTSVTNWRGESILLVGLDSAWAGQPRIPVNFQQDSRRKAVLTLLHEPDYFDVIRREHSMVLQLSGHTHGGQCRVPWLKYAPVKVHLGRKYLEGAFQEGASQLFVTRGIGTVGLRVRFGCPPELALLTLGAV